MVQPSFIFPSDNTNTTNSTNTNTTSTNTITVEDLKAGSNYIIGVGLCLFAAASVAVATVINVRIQRSNPR